MEGSLSVVGRRATSESPGVLFACSFHKQCQNRIGIGGVVSELIPYLSRKTRVMFEIDKTKTGLLFSNKMVTT